MAAGETAAWMTGILREVESQRRADLRALETHPFGQTFLALTPKDHDLVRKIFEAEARLRES